MTKLQLALTQDISRYAGIEGWTSCRVVSRQHGIGMIWMGACGYDVDATCVGVVCGMSVCRYVHDLCMSCNMAYARERERERSERAREKDMDRSLIT